MTDVHISFAGYEEGTPRLRFTKDRPMGGVMSQKVRFTNEKEKDLINALLACRDADMALLSFAQAAFILGGERGCSE